MKILSASIQNFASYKNLSFDFNQGLCLIQGATGAGKSTLCDVVPWILFGKTGKGGSVDEILSWPGDGITTGTLCLENLTVVRTRGPKAKDNDLSWQIDEASVSFRGKDLVDTQKLINGLVGADYESYSSGAYFHEFSQTAQFFVTTAKNRRALCEQLVDLTLAKKLQDRALNEYTTINKQLSETDRKINGLMSAIDVLNRIQISESTKASIWAESHERAKELAAASYDKFEAGRKKIITKQCNSCGTVLAKPKDVIDDSVNPYLVRLAQLEIEMNPYTAAAKDYSAEIKAKKDELLVLQDKLSQHRNSLEELDLLRKVVNDYRSVTIENAIKTIEYDTNQLLAENFDAEIKISFEVADADKLEVEIMKDGNICSYTQLSKGQRGILKLCFGVSVMKSVTNNSVDFGQIFFDEALSGLDDTMKVKAYRLFETLSLVYDSVFVIDHSEELKSMFTNKLTVELVNGHSRIETM